MAAPLGTQIRERILESAAALMEERSFFDISLADIARAARISKGTLYYYYNSRDAILFDLTDRYLQKLSDDLLAWVDNEEKDTVGFFRNGRCGLGGARAGRRIPQVHLYPGG